MTIDTFRADRLGVGLTPTIDRLAASGVRFTDARTAVPLTLPSHTTLMTGLLPPAHGVRENGVDRLSDRHQTLARLLREAGYQTAAFVGAFVLDRRFGLAQGFDTYDDRIARDPAATDRLEAERPASAVIDGALAWFTAPNRDLSSAPFFVWIHLYDPHTPYNPPAEFLERAKQARAATPGPSATSHQPPATTESQQYDGEILYADAQIGRLVAWLDARHLLERTVVVVAGDHGEGLDEHGERTHGMLLYDSTLRVPLIVAAPPSLLVARGFSRAPGGATSRAPSRASEPVSLVDVAPTVLRAAGVAPPAEMRGRDLLNVRLKPDATETRRDRDIYAETEYPRVAGWSPLQALTDGRFVTIRSGSSNEVYDLGSDPGELHDLATAQAGIARGMSARIDAIRAAGSGASPTHVVSDQASERLRALGYVTSAGSAAPASDAPNPAATIAAWSEFEEALAALNAKRPGASSRLQRLAAQHREAAILQTTFARGLKDAGELDRALAEYRAAARRWPADAMLLHDLAVAARDAAGAASGAKAHALRDEAARAEQAALVLAPESAAAHNGLGLLAADLGQTSDAVHEFERATDADATNASYWTNLGNARRAAADRAGAEQAYRQALTIEAQAVDALNGLGVLLVEARHAAEAAPWFERAVAASPGFVEARLNLGIALQQSGQLPRAAEAYRAVLAAPGDHRREKAAAAKLLASLGAR